MPDQPSVVHSWPILDALAKFRTAEFDQRAIVLTQFRADVRVPVGACPGLSAEWIRLHARWPNQSPKERVQALDKAAVWEDAASYTQAFNKPADGKEKVLTYAQRVEERLLLSNKAVFSTSEPGTAAGAAALCVYFDPNNKYSFITAYLSGTHANHVCAGYASTTGRIFKSKHLTFFDSNFGEFDIELTKSAMKKFMDAWIAQFATYKSGRTGAKTKLTLDKFEVVQLQDVIGTRARR